MVVVFIRICIKFVCLCVDYPIFMTFTFVFENNLV